MQKRGGAWRPLLAAASLCVVFAAIGCSGDDDASEPASPYAEACTAVCKGISCCEQGGISTGCGSASDTCLKRCETNNATTHDVCPQLVDDFVVCMRSGSVSCNGPTAFFSCDTQALECCFDAAQKHEDAQHCLSTP